MLRVDLVLRVVKGVLVAVIVHSFCIPDSLQISHSENGSLEVLSSHLNDSLRQFSLIEEKVGWWEEGDPEIRPFYLSNQREASAASNPRSLRPANLRAYGRSHTIKKWFTTPTCGCCSFGISLSMKFLRS